MAWQLRIECKSAVCSGSGLGQPGQVDRDVVLDSFGLPYIPGKRLKAMLSEAYQELSLYKKCADPEDIFGRAGDNQSGPFSIRRAEVAGAARIRTWLNHSDNPLSRQDVVDAFTEIRRQTAMSRESGAPQENTLRATRVLRKGLVLFAPVDGVEKWDVAVGDAARALQFMGTGRTRGWGHVRCKLEQIATETKSIVADPGVEPGGCLGIRLRLEDPAIFPVLAGDPNTVLTDDCIPGSVVRGILAGRYIAKYGVDDRFYDLFFSDRVRFFSGNPRIGTKRVGIESMRSAPVPASLREIKSAEGSYIDLAECLPEEPVRRVRGWCRLPECTKGSSEYGQVLTRLQYHNARAADQRIGRAVGEQHSTFEGLTASQSGAFFTYEALLEGQEFDAEIRGSQTDLDVLRELIENGEKIRIGRSRNAEYGGVVWRWQSQQETASVPKAGVPCTKVVVTLLSDLIGVNEHGHPAPEFPFADLAAALDVKLDVDNARSFVQTSWQAGYMAHQRLPRQQMPSLGAGTVFVVPLVEPAKPNFQQALDRSYGLRIEEGFGQIALSSASGEVRVNLPTDEKLTPSPSLASNSPEWRVATQVFRSHVERRAVNRALVLAGRASAEQLGKVSNSLLSRILLFLERKTLADTATELNSLRTPAKSQLSKLWVREKIGAKANAETRHLHDFLLWISQNYLSVYSWLQNDEVYGKPINNWKRAFPDGAPEPTDADFPLKIVRLYLRQFIRALLWKKRGLAKTALATSGEEVQVNG